MFIENSQLENLKYTFFNQKPIEVDKIRLTEEEQVSFLDATIRHKNVVKYPIKLSFCKFFLKKLIYKLEESGQSVVDDFYNIYCDLLQQEDKDEYCYRHYLLDKYDSIVIIKESCRLISNGTTGLHTWEAALVLAEWCLLNKERLLEKNILELGAGVGFLGLIVSKHCNIKRYCLTDMHYEVLKLLEENVKLNYDHKLGNKITSQKLDWENFKDKDLPFKPDIVFGSDIVYDSSIFEPLCQVMNTILKISPKTRIILMNTVRNNVTSDSFFQHLRNNKLEFKTLTMPAKNLFSWDTEREYIFIEINVVEF